MQRKTLLNHSLIIGLLLALSLAPASLPHAVASQTSAEQVDPSAIQVNVGSSFSYQGFLAQDGHPVNATCRFVFALFDRLAGGNQLGANQEVGGVTVSDGSFALVLNGANQFGNDAFNGQARWLEITVDCGSGSSTLSPRQELLGTPYALSLRPGAVVTGNGPENSGLLSLVGGYHGLRVLSTSDDGIYVDSAGDNGIRTAAANYGGFFNGGVGGVLAAALTAQGPDLVLGGFTDSDGVYHGEGRIATSPLSASSSLYLQSNGNATIQLDADASGENASFELRDRTNNLLFVAESSGNVGIGANNPQGKLEITSPDFNDHLVLNRAGAGAMHVTATNPRGLAITDGSNTFVQVQQATGNVGIGTNNPQGKLEITSPDFNDHLVLNRTDAGAMHVTATNPRGLAITDGTDNSFVQVIQASGYVGIGTNNPQSNLHVSNGDFTRLRLTATSPADDVQMFVDARGDGVDRGQLGTTSNHDVAMFANNQPLIVLGRDGSVCIGNC